MVWPRGSTRLCQDALPRSSNRLGWKAEQFWWVIGPIGRHQQSIRCTSIRKWGSRLMFRLSALMQEITRVTILKVVLILDAYFNMYHRFYGQIHVCDKNTVPSQKRAHYGILAYPPLWAQRLLEYAPMCSCPWKCSLNGWSMRTELQLVHVHVRSIGNLP